MNIDWDGVAENASQTPRALLAELEPELDDITCLVVIYHSRSRGQQRVGMSTDSLAMAIAMLATAQVQLCNEANEG